MQQYERQIKHKYVGFDTHFSRTNSDFPGITTRRLCIPVLCQCVTQKRIALILFSFGQRTCLVKKTCLVVGSGNIVYSME